MTTTQAGALTLEARRLYDAVLAAWMAMPVATTDRNTYRRMTTLRRKCWQRYCRRDVRYAALMNSRTEVQA